jgi:hypothetical protein
MTMTEPEASKQVKEQAKEVTQGTIDKLTDIAQQASPITPSQELKRRIIKVAQRGIWEYYERWPERALDDRGRDNQDLHVRCVRDILAVIDEYHIARLRDVNDFSGGT